MIVWSFLSQVLDSDHSCQIDSNNMTSNNQNEPAWLSWLRAFGLLTTLAGGVLAISNLMDDQIII